MFAFIYLLKQTLFIKIYLPEYESLITDIEAVDAAESLNQISNKEVFASFLEKYHKVKLQGLKGELGSYSPILA